MKNFTVNQSNQNAEHDEKLISYQFAGGVSAAILFYSVFFSVVCFIISIAILTICITSEQFINSGGIVFLFFSFLLFILCVSGSVATAIVRIKICNRYSNRGFDLYSDKIVFTRDTASLQIEQRKIVSFIILSCLIPGFYIYWLWLQVKNTKVLGNDQSNLYGELPLLLFVPFYSYYWFFTRGELVKKELQKRGYSSSSNGVAFLILSIFGLGLIALAIMQNDFNNIPDDIIHKEKQQSLEESYSLNEIDKLYIANRALCVESKNEKRVMPLTSRDFRNNLNNVLQNIAA